MAVPKRRQAKARTRKRRANWTLEGSSTVECPQCHEPRLPHRVCRECGYYKGRQVLTVKEK